MAANTMDAIKKKMQAMKLEKEGALDKADQLDQALNDQKEKNEKVSKFREEGWCSMSVTVTLSFKTK